jgi:hypothetical protein
MGVWRPTALDGRAGRGEPVGRRKQGPRLRRPPPAGGCGGVGGAAARRRWPPQELRPQRQREQRGQPHAADAAAAAAAPCTGQHKRGGGRRGVRRAGAQPGGQRLGGQRYLQPGAAPGGLRGCVGVRGRRGAGCRAQDRCDLSAVSLVHAAGGRAPGVRARAAGLRGQGRARVLRW